jgi:hypothetical protein
VQNQTQNWTKLFNATKFTSLSSRESTPDATSEEQTPILANSEFDGEFQSLPSASDIGFLDDEYMQQLLPWQSSEFQWNETASLVSIKASNGMLHSSAGSSGETDQNLMEPLANPFSPMTRWNASNGFSSTYRGSQ